jgi:hypothetical protein
VGTEHADALEPESSDIGPTRDGARWLSRKGTPSVAAHWRRSRARAASVKPGVTEPAAVRREHEFEEGTQRLLAAHGRPPREEGPVEELHDIFGN